MSGRAVTIQKAAERIEKRDCAKQARKAPAHLRQALKCEGEGLLLLFVTKT